MKHRVGSRASSLPMQTLADACIGTRWRVRARADADAVAHELRYLAVKVVAAVLPEASVNSTP